MRILATALAALLLAISTAHGQEVAGPGGPTDASAGYWKNLFANTMRYTLRFGQPDAEIVDLWFYADATVRSDRGYSGHWRVEGEQGSQMFCYDLGGLPRAPTTLNECFPLRLMYRPRIGATWTGAFREQVPYQAIVVEGRKPEAPP